MPRISLAAIREFWKLPEGKQFLSACFVVIGILASVIVYMYLTKDGPAKEERVKTEALQKEVSNLHVYYGTKMLDMQKSADSLRQADKAELIAELKATIAGMSLKEKEFDKALRNANATLQIQKTTSHNIKQAIREVKSSN